METIDNSTKPATAELLADLPQRMTLDRVNPRVVGFTLLLLFLTAAGVQNAIVLTWINVTGGNLSQPGTIYGLALVFAQQGLVALACGFSRQHIAVRTSLFLAAVLISGDLACRYDGRSGLYGTWMVTMLAHGLFVLSGVCFRRITGTRLILKGDGSGDESSRWQFNLLRLFGVMTIAAVLLGIFSRFRVNSDELPDMLYQAAMLALPPLQVAFCVLTKERFVTTVVLGFATVCLVGGILGFMLPDWDLLSMLWLTLLQSLMMHAAVSIVRQAGYRIVERNGHDGR